MKNIIFDHFRRWRLVLIAILIAYFAIQAFSIHESNSQSSADPTVASIQHTINIVHSSFVFQAIMWLGFLLMWDLQRGLPRVLTSLPVTPKQIGRAWWLASVAFPAISLGVIGLLAILFFSGGTNTLTLMENYSMKWLLATLYLGAMFGALTFMATTMPDNFTDKIRVLLPNMFFPFTMMGFILLQIELLTMTKTILFFAAFAILSVLGWFRAERMVLQRAGFRPVSKSSSKKTTPHKIPQGFGGLRYLAQRSFVLSTLIGLAIISWMTLVTSYFHVGPDSVQEIVSRIEGGSIPYVFCILMFSIVPIVFQLRFLRTLPIFPSALAATLVFLPVISITAVGLLVTAVTSMVAGEAVIPPAASSFLMLGAKAAIIVPLVVWRGLEAPTYLLIFLLVLSDSFISLGVTIIFHLGSKTPEHPWWISLTIFFLCVAASFALTHRLLTKSSSAYRVRTMPANAWSMARR